MNRETWLITGGAGYIGTHVADLFIADGFAETYTEAEEFKPVVPVKAKAAKHEGK